MAKPCFKNALIISLSVSLIAAVASLVPSSLFAHWSDSELWSIGVAKLFGTETSDHPALLYKPLFSFILHQVYHIDIGNIATVNAVRVLFSLIGAALAGMVFVFARAIGVSLIPALWCCFLFSTTTFFLGQGFRVRSDILAALLQMLALIHFVRLAKTDRQPAASSYIIAIAIPLLMLACTPKAVYMLLVNGVLIGSVVWRKKPHLRRFAAIVIGTPLALLGGMVLWKLEPLIAALKFFTQSFASAPHHPPYFSKASFFYILRFIKENFHLILLFIVGVIASRKSETAGTSIEDIFDKGLRNSALLSLLIIFFHNDRLSFFILSLLPMISVYVGIHSWRALDSRSWTRKLMPIAMALIFLNGAWFVSRMYERGSNRLQRQAVHTIEAHIKQNPNALIYDAMVALPREKQIYAWPETGDKDLVENFKEVIQNPKIGLFLFGNRLFPRVNEIMALLEEQPFIQIGSGVFARGILRPVYRKDGIRPFTVERMNMLCDHLKSPLLHLYEGDHFMKMRYLSSPPDFPWSCGMTPRRMDIQTGAGFTVVTSYTPIELPEGKAFAQIFDHDPDF